MAFGSSNILLTYHIGWREYQTKDSLIQRLKLNSYVKFSIDFVQTLIFLVGSFLCGSLLFYPVLCPIGWIPRNFKIVIFESKMTTRKIPGFLRIHPIYDQSFTFSFIYAIFIQKFNSGIKIQNFEFSRNSVYPKQ